jgi:molybdopterin converting factor small subunit
MHADSSSPPAGGLRVAVFAGLAEAAGSRFVELPWVGGTVADLRAAVAARVPAAAALLGRSAVAVDGRHAGEADAVPSSAEVAILPPVSGG